MIAAMIELYSEKLQHEAIEWGVRVVDLKGEFDQRVQQITERLVTYI